MRDPFAQDETIDWDRMPQAELKAYLDGFSLNSQNHPKASVPQSALREQRLTMLRSTNQNTAAVIGENTLAADLAIASSPTGLALTGYTGSTVENDFLKWDPALNNRITVKKTALYDVSLYGHATRTPNTGAFFEFWVAFNGDRTGPRHRSYLISPYNAGGVEVGRASVVGPPLILEAGTYAEFIYYNSTAVVTVIAADATRAIYNSMTLRVVGGA